MALMKFSSGLAHGAVGQAALRHVVQGFERQVRIDGAGAVADQQREVHDLARLARFDDQRDLRAGLLADQVVVHGGQRQQAGDGRVVLVHAAVGENQQGVARLDGQRRAAAELVERALQALLAVLHREKHGQRGGEEIALRDAAQLFQIAIGQDGLRQLERVAVLRRLVQDVALGADVAGERHHHLFADRIDGRIGHLREQLLEVIEQRLRLVGETGERRIGAHGADRLLALLGHGTEDHLEVFVGVAEGALPDQQGGRVGADARAADRPGCRA